MNLNPPQTTTNPYWKHPAFILAVVDFLIIAGVIGYLIYQERTIEVVELPSKLYDAVQDQFGEQ